MTDDAGVTDAAAHYAPEIDGEPDPGEVVWAWVPYEDDPSQGKDRPVLVLAPDERGAGGEAVEHEVLLQLALGRVPDADQAVRGHADPDRVATEYDAGQRRVDVARVVAGVEDPPGPDELRRMVDDVLRGIARGDFAVTLFRAAAFARIVAAGRAGLECSHDEIARILALSEQLEAAGHGEIANTLA